MYSLNENFNKAAGLFKDRIAIESRIAGRLETITYGRLSEEVKGLAYFIFSQGVRKYDKVAIILENRPGWPIVFFAVSYIGAVAVPIDPHLTQGEIKNLIFNSGARLIFVSKENKALQESVGQGIKFISLDTIEVSNAPEGFKASDVDPEDLMVILYTSGTTDLPKGVMLTHKNLCANYYSIKRLGLFSYKDTVLSILPLYHSYPLMTTLILPVFSGAKIVYVASDWPERLAECLKNAGISIFIGVPQIFHAMHNRIMKKIKEAPFFIRLYINLIVRLGLTKVFLPKLRTAFGKDLRFFACGGAKLDEDVARDFLRLGFKILEGYGLTETSPVVSFSPLQRPRIGSVGLTLPDVKVKIVNKDATGIGEIAIQGPNVMKGYYRDEKGTASVIIDGWFLSGDLGYIDKEGYLFITGRSKEVIVLSSGKNIYPEEVERHYSESPYIKEMCVLGVLKEKGRGKIEYLHAIIVPQFDFFKERGEMNVRSVLKDSIEQLSKRLAPHKHIMGFSVSREDLPRTVLGKIKRYEVEKKFLPVILSRGGDRKEGLIEEERFESETAVRLIKCIKDAVNIKGPVRLSDSIELDLGVDSLGRVELVCAIERCFNIELPEEMVAGEIFTVKDLLYRVEEELKKDHKEVCKEEVMDTKTVSWPYIIKQSLSHEFQRRILLYPRWIDYIFTFIVKGVVGVFFRIFYSLRTEGSYRIPRKGPYILCVNHTSFLDGFIVSAGVPLMAQMQLFFIGFRRYFIVPIIRDLVKSARIIPIDATQILEAMQSSAFILRHNKALCIFPEGERSIDGEVKEFKKGIGIIAKELNVVLVPVFIKGAYEAWPRTEKIPRLHPIGIIFGSPLLPDTLIYRGMALGAKDEYEAISMAMREEIIKLRYFTK